MLSSPTVDSFKQVITFKTLQSDDRGHFKTFLQSLKKSSNIGSLLNELETTPSYADKLCIMAKVPQFQYLKPQEMFTRKNDGEAEKHRQHGNAEYNSSNITKAFQYYSLGIIKASPMSEVISKLYANRSACLFSLGQYEEALLDIEEALSSNCHSDLVIKLQNRKEKCMDKVDIQASNANILKDHGSDNKLNVSYGGPKIGRYVSASSNISTGDALLSESPVGSVLYNDKCGSHCVYCFSRLVAGYPCEACCDVAFCSPICRKKASFHQFECRYQEFLTGLGISSIGRLALRLITSKPFDYFLKIRKYLNDTNETLESNSEFEYINIYNLTGNGEQRWQEDIFHRITLSSLLTKILVSSNYFGSHPKERDIHYIGSLITRNLDVIQFNAHEVYEFVRKDNQNLKPSKQIAIGLAIYQRASYMNHSCKGSAVRYFKGNQIFMRALHPIKQGEPIFDNYGPTFYFKETKDRQKELKDRYWFNCNCQACQENWSLLNDLISIPKESLSYNKKLKQDSFKDLIHFIESNYVDGKMPTESIVRAIDKFRTVCYNMGSVHYLNK
ncbi:SET and MYND domain-containing protein 4 [Lepeophtheirus salmonis]|uniref:SET and MYND domain-containing protein 4 n=1 Tax=Lepeophtheirus salmonis TaxID=72036 RepID=UPI001AE2BDA2|nr:SET and MYND domain-containing protein 4-like [Lepeophtheirus salmonis]